MLAPAHSHLQGLPIAQSKHFRLLTCLSLPMFIIAKEKRNHLDHLLDVLPAVIKRLKACYAAKLFTGTATLTTYKGIVFFLRYNNDTGNEVCQESRG